jgi:hypothetical protein
VHSNAEDPGQHSLQCMHCKLTKLPTKILESSFSILSHSADMSPPHPSRRRRRNHSSFALLALLAISPIHAALVDASPWSLDIPNYARLAAAFGDRPVRIKNPHSAPFTVSQKDGILPILDLGSDSGGTGGGKAAGDATPSAAKAGDGKAASDGKGGGAASEGLLPQTGDTVGGLGSALRDDGGKPAGDGKGGGTASSGLVPQAADTVGGLVASPQDGTAAQKAKAADLSKIDLQSFGSALGGIRAPSIIMSDVPTRPFQVVEDKFVSYTRAIVLRISDSDADMVL